MTDLPHEIPHPKQLDTLSTALAPAVPDAAPPTVTGSLPTKKEPAPAALSVAKPTAAQHSRVRWVQFFAGFIGWFLASGLFLLVLWAAMSVVPPRNDITRPLLTFLLLLSFVPLLASVGLMIYLGLRKKTRLAALGIFTAVAANSVLCLLQGLYQDLVLMWPFYFSYFLEIQN